MRLTKLDRVSRETFFDRFLLIISTIEGIQIPPAGTTAYKMIRLEVEDIMFNNAYSILTEAEVQSAFRMNADGLLGVKVESYNTISRKFIAAVLNSYLRKKSDTILKLESDRQLNPPPDDVATTEQKEKALEDLMHMQWQDFKIGKLDINYVYPKIYEYIVARLKPGKWTQPENVNVSLYQGCHLRIKNLESLAVSQHDLRRVESLKRIFFHEKRVYDDEWEAVMDCAKRLWIMAFFTDLQNNKVDLKTVLYERA